MVVCPVCGATGREGTGVCVNGHRFAPGTDERTEPRTHRVSARPAYGKLAILILTVTLAVGAYLFSAVSGATRDHDTLGPLRIYAEGIRNGIAEGTITPESVATMRESARVQSNCGYVAEFVLNAPSGGSTGGFGIGGGAQDPVQLAEQYITTEFRADAVVGTMSADEKSVIVAAAWACE